MCNVNTNFSTHFVDRLFFPMIKKKSGNETLKEMKKKRGLVSLSLSKTRCRKNGELCGGCGGATASQKNNTSGIGMSDT